jgi:actin-like ATPase involved in cell morphogenesis
MSVWDDLIQKLAFLDIEQQERVLAFVNQIDNGQDVNRIVVYVTISALKTDITVKTKYTYRGSQVKGMLGLIDTVADYLQSKSDHSIGRDFATYVLQTTGLSPLSEDEAKRLIVGHKVSRGEIYDSIRNQADELITEIKDQIEALFVHFPMVKNPLTQQMLVLRGEFRHVHGLDQVLQEATGLKVIVE